MRGALIINILKMDDIIGNISQCKNPNTGGFVVWVITIIVEFYITKSTGHIEHYFANSIIIKVAKGVRYPKV